MVLEFENRSGLRVRRKLMFYAAACVCGVYAAGVRADAYAFALGLCAVLFVMGIRRLRARHTAVLWVTLAMLFLGYGLAGMRLSAHDEATRYGVLLSGRVSRIVSGTRVILEDVSVDDDGVIEHLRFPAAVTLMRGEEEQCEGLVGRWVEGTGRLFAPETPRNPGEIDQRVQAICDGYELSGYILPGWTVTGEEAFSITEVFRKLREIVLAHFDRVFGEDAALYQAILLGTKDEMDSDVVRAMRLTGIAHILTVSGMHLSLVALGLDWLLPRWRQRSRFVVKMLLLWMFAMLTGCAAGTIRAFIMAFISALASQLEREYDPLTGLSAAALLMTLINPVWPLDGGFQFSFFVTLGILLLGNRLYSFFNKHCLRALKMKLRAALLPMLSVSVSAQIASLPIQLLFYGYVPLLSLPMNLLVGLLIPVVMMAGFACALIGAFSIEIGVMCATVLGLPGRLFERLSVAAAGIDGSILRLPAPYAVTIAFAVALMALFSDQILFRRRLYRLRKPVAVGMVLLYLLRFDPTPRYVQLDVGQGDAAVIRWGRHAALIDVGPEDSSSMLRYLRHEGLFADLLVLSHLDEDHAGALGTLLSSEIEIRQLTMAVGAEDDVGSQVVTRALAQAEGQGISKVLLDCGDNVYVDGVHFEVLSPDESLSGSNERSLVLLTELGGVRILTTGDLPLKSEMETWPDCDVLKVAHHGSKNATSAAMLEQTTPQIALISVGARNSYGHPTERVLNDLEAVGAETYRTDEDGCVVLRLHDGKCWVWTAAQFMRFLNGAP